MTFIVWDDSLDLHIDIIDEEHKILINLMNKLYEDVEDGAILSDKTVTKLNKLIYAKKLMSEQLIIDLKQYIADNNQ